MPSTSLPLVNARPRFVIDGRPNPDLAESALALDVHLPRSGMGALEVRAVNWSGTDFRFGDVRLGQEIRLFLTEDSDSEIFAGDITAIEERYGDGAPQMVVLAEDKLHKLARTRNTRAFEDMSLDAVIQQIAGDAGLTASVRASSVSSTWLQNNESDLAFLLRQLNPLDIGLRWQDDALWAKDEEPDPSPLVLSNASNTRHIRLIADLNHQPFSVASQGYDLSSAAETSGRATSMQPAPQDTPASRYLSSAGWRSESVLPQPFARSQAQADELARKGFRRAAGQFVHGEIVCVDAPSLRSGREIRLEDVSSRFAGRYRVVDCHHRFDLDQGFRTHIRVQRPDWRG